MYVPGRGRSHLSVAGSSVLLCVPSLPGGCLDLTQMVSDPLVAVPCVHRCSPSLVPISMYFSSPSHGRWSWHSDMYTAAALLVASCADMVANRCRSARACRSGAPVQSSGVCVIPPCVCVCVFVHCSLWHTSCGLSERGKGKGDMSFPWRCDDVCAPVGVSSLPMSRRQQHKRSYCSLWRKNDARRGRKQQQNYFASIKWSLTLLLVPRTFWCKGRF